LFVSGTDGPSGFAIEYGTLVWSIASPPEGLAGLVLRLLARDPDIAKQRIVELTQVLTLAPLLMHAPERSEHSRKNCASYCRLAPTAQSLSQL
jgi:hypothetical protein